MSEYIAKAHIEPRDYRVVFLIQKRAQGKHHLVAVGAVSRKLTTVVYAILKSGKPYKAVKFV